MRLTLGQWVFVAVIAVAVAYHFVAVRSAVRQATEGLVKESEVRAASRVADVLRQEQEWLREQLRQERQRTEEIEAANVEFRLDQAARDREAEDLQDEIDELLARAVPDACTVDADLLERLRQ